MLLLGCLLLLRSRADLRVITCGLHITSSQFLVLLYLLLSLLLISLVYPACRPETCVVCDGQSGYHSWHVCMLDRHQYCRYWIECLSVRWLMPVQAKLSHELYPQHLSYWQFWHLVRKGAIATSLRHRVRGTHLASGCGQPGCARCL